MTWNDETRVVRADGTPVKVLVVDDEPLIAELLTIALRREGWHVSTARDGSSAMSAATREQPDLAVLDIALPDTDGLTLMHALRALSPKLPVLLLTGRATAEDRIAGLAQGGDDYVTKPFSLEEVVLRMRGLIRRSGVVTDLDRGRLVVGDLILDLYSHEVTREGRKVELTMTEFKLLGYLMQNSGRVVTKPQILRDVWHSDFDGNPNLVEIFVSYLRKKIDSGRRPMIHTVRGRGYLLQPR
ncbi:putative transcriptional regulatory protein TcrX [Mycolicibacterium madagascariense]|uniref:Putative transcriptional regulatory protein TcrX n=1 Tax=Mycolicibacterium madagascariense TaxID=212765 RepID=A0A7I7XEJ1_9MYCO|nr:putative transcriptional regulatory protein TcrX [Mycolicibacterium madagascariense]